MRPYRFAAPALLCLVSVFLLTSCGPSVDVYYSSSLNGNLLGCDCWGYPEAGLDKRAWYLGEHPRPEGSLLLDAGNVLETGRDPYLADLILETYRELGYDAVAVGTHELAEGLDVLVERTVAGNLISHNLMVDRLALTVGPVIKETENGVVLAVVALADPDWFAPYLAQFDGRLSVADPGAVLAVQRAEAAAAGASGVVVLAHGSEEWIRALFTDARGNARSDDGDDGAPVAAVILAGEESLVEDKLPGGIPLLSPGEEGNRLGMAEFRLRPRRSPKWKNEFVEFHYLGPGDDVVASRGAEYQAYLDRKRSD